MTIMDQAIERTVNEYLCDPDWAYALATILGKVQNGFYEDWIVDVLCQKWERFPFTIYDAYSFACVFSDMCHANIVMAQVHIGEEPGKDKDIEGNNKKLQSLGNGFSARFWGGTQDEDGVFEIEKTIVLDMKSHENGKRVTKSVNGSFPLEVGYMDSSKAMLYLNGPVGRLARWPYGHESIYLMARAREG